MINLGLAPSTPPWSRHPDGWRLLNTFLKGRFYIIQITKHEAELIRELCPETHIRIVNAGKSSKAKNRFMSEESKALRTLGMIRGTINKEHGGHANAV